MQEAPEAFRLDQDYVFSQGEHTPVSGNTFRLISQSRYQAHFQLFGDFDEHLGEFSSNKANLVFTVAAKSSTCC